MAGTGAAGIGGDGGSALDAEFQQPGAIALGPDGAYYVVDEVGCVIRKIADGTVTTVAGTGVCGYGGDGGPATAAQIKPVIQPTAGMSEGGLAIDASGNLYLADSGNGRIRKISTGGTISTVADGFDASNSFATVNKVAVTTSGELYAVTALSGLLRVDAGSTTPVLSGYFTSVTSDPDGGLYLAPLTSGGIEHWVEGAAEATPVAARPSSGTVFNLATDAHGTLYMATETEVYRSDGGSATPVAGNGTKDPMTGAQAGMGRNLSLSPLGIAGTVNDGLLVSSGHVVYRIDRPGMVAGCDSSVFKPGADLSGRDLSGMTFDGCDLTGANLERANLTGANLSGAVFGTSGLTRFDGANLSGADLSGLDLSHSEMNGANLRGADVSGTNLDLPATLSGVTSGDLVGVPSALPDHWTIGRGFLIGPGAVLTGADLSGLDLTGLDLTGSHLEGADLTGSTLDGLRSGDITGTPTALPAGWVLKGGVLIGPGADLSNTVIDDKDLSGVSFTGVNLTGADLQRSDLSGADLSGAIVSPTVVTDFYLTDLSGADLSGLDLSNGELNGATLTGANITGTNLGTPYTGGVKSGGLIGSPAALPESFMLVNGYLIGPDADLTGGALSGLTLTNLDLSGTTLNGADLSGTDLSGTDLPSARIQSANLDDAILTNAILTSADLYGTSLTGAAIDHAALTAAQLTHADLSGADLTGTDLQYVDLSWATLTGTRLTDAVLAGATLDFTAIEDANFSGADLSGVSSTGLSGTPSALPTGWAIVNGSFVPPPE
jgi:uncharacterized protein YjbI with pentapeptide repeats